MRVKVSLFLAIAAIPAVCASASPAWAARPVCSDGSRACLMKTAGLYLEGLSRHDSSRIPFTPNVRATEQGNVVVTNEAKFRTEIDGSTAIVGARNIRMMTDPQTQSVGAFYV